MKRLFLSTLLLISVTCGAMAQRVAVKTNLLYDATATINFGVEVGLGKRTSLDISGNYNGWDIDAATNRKMKHYFVQPEFRLWTCEKFNGHFFGVHALYGKYNVSGSNWFVDSGKMVSNVSSVDFSKSRYEGTGVGAGISYGYSLILANRWNLEFTVGGGYVYLDYDRYGSPKCSPKIESANKHYFGLTKTGVTLSFIIK